MRDELVLQAHLLKAEARDRWHQLEQTWKDFTAEVDRISEATDDSDENTDAFARRLTEELKEGFLELQRALKDPLA